MKDQKELLVSRIEITNILGIKHLEFRPGKGLTTATSENAGGKTSICEAIRSIFKGGQDCTLLRAGAEKGEIVLELNNGVKIERTVTPTRSATLVTDPTYGQISKPKAFLEQLIDTLGMNPVDFLTAPAKVRTQLLLEAMPIKLDNDLIEPIIGHTVDELDTDALELIAREIKRFYDDRTGVNRVAKEKRATIEQMKQTLPDGDDDTDWNRVVKTLDTQIATINQNLGSKIDEITNELDGQKAASRANESHSIDEIERNLQLEISRLRTEAEAKKDQIRENVRVGLDILHKGAQTAIDAERNSVSPKQTELTSKLAVARENLANQSKLVQTREYIKQLVADAEANERQSKTDTQKIEQLEALKVSLLANLPIKGIEIKDGEILVDGITFDRVNEARKVDLAIQIAQLRSGRLPLIIVDGLERLDSKTFAAFKKAAEKSKVQMIVTRVSDSALAVEA